MRVTNLTSAVQKLRVTSLIGERETYDIFVQPHGTTDLSQKLSFDASDYAGIFAFDGESVKKVAIKEETKVEPVEAVEEVKEEEPQESEVEDPEVTEETPEPEVESESFICDICGAEFASERGLKAHKKKAHQE